MPSRTGLAREQVQARRLQEAVECLVSATAVELRSQRTLQRRAALKNGRELAAASPIQTTRHRWSNVHHSGPLPRVPEAQDAHQHSLRRPGTGSELWRNHAKNMRSS